MMYWDASFPLAMLISQLFLQQSCLLKERDSDTSLFAASCLFVIESLHAPASCCLQSISVCCVRNCSRIVIYKFDVALAKGEW